MNITLRQLRAFRSVADAASFTLAANNMHLTQSAVSMLVRQLETEFGMPLFDRVNRKVLLTEAGRQILPLARRMLDDLRQVEEGAVDMRELQRGILRLAVPQMLACAWIPDAIGEFRARYPNVTLKLFDTTPDRIISSIQAHEAEIGIGPERAIPNDLQADFLWDEPLQIVCPADSPLADKPKLRWRDTVGERWIIYSNEFSGHIQRTLESSQTSLRLSDATEVRYLTTALSLVSKGVGVTVAPRYANNLASGFNVRFIDLEDEPNQRAFSVYQRNGYELSPAASAFVEMLRERVSQKRDF